MERCHRIEDLRPAAVRVEIGSRVSILRIGGVSTPCYGLVTYSCQYQSPRVGEAMAEAQFYPPPRFTQVPSPKTPPPAQNEFVTTSIGLAVSVSVSYSAKNRQGRKIPKIIGGGVRTNCPGGMTVDLDWIVLCLVDNVDLDRFR